MKKRDFKTYQKRFRDFEILPNFSETHVFKGTIRHPSREYSWLGGGSVVHSLEVFYREIFALEFLRINSSFC